MSVPGVSSCLTCVCGPAVRDSLGKVWRGFCAQETPLSELQHLSLGLGEDESGGSQYLAHTRHTDTRASQTHGGLRWDLQGCVSAPVTPPGLLSGEQPGGAGWGARSMWAWGRGERERGISSLLSESDGPQTCSHPPTHVHMYLHDTVLVRCMCTDGHGHDNCTEPRPAAPLSRRLMRTRH